MPPKKQAGSSRANAKKTAPKKAAKPAAKKAAPKKSARKAPAARAAAAPATPATTPPSTPASRRTDTPVVAERLCRARLTGTSTRCDRQHHSENSAHRGDLDGARIEWGAGIEGYRPSRANAE